MGNSTSITKTQNDNENESWPHNEVWWRWRKKSTMKARNHRCKNYQAKENLDTTPTITEAQDREKHNQKKRRKELPARTNKKAEPNWIAVAKEVKRKYWKHQLKAQAEDQKKEKCRFGTGKAKSDVERKEIERYDLGFDQNKYPNQLQPHNPKTTPTKKRWRKAPGTVNKTQPSTMLMARMITRRCQRRKAKEQRHRTCEILNENTPKERKEKKR